jgi:hypothetical protein
MLLDCGRQKYLAAYLGGLGPAVLNTEYDMEYRGITRASGDFRNSRSSYRRHFVFRYAFGLALITIGFVTGGGMDS